MAVFCGCPNSVASASRRTKIRIWVRVRDSAAGKCHPTRSPRVVAGVVTSGFLLLTGCAGNDVASDTIAIRVGREPRAVAVDENSVWVANRADGSVLRIDPGTNKVLASIPAGREPYGIAVGAGSVWVANRGDGTVVRIDPGTNK